MLYYVWLQCVLGAGSSHLKDAIIHFGSARAIYEAGDEERKASKLFSKSILERMKKTPLSKAEEIIRKCKNENISILTVADKSYPKCLKNLSNPPTCLYYKGVFPDFDNEPTICIVGPRNVSEYGKGASFSLSARLARAGFIIVSGGALGSDTYAHKGALKYGQKTVLFMGCGINFGYLPENEKMRKLIVKTGGCLISEFPPDAPPLGVHFPVRNRLMSAVSCGTVVIEAKKRSGALITANYALEQGKDVFVVPGTPGNPQYEGSNILLREGAIPLIDATDVISEYISLFPDKIDIERAYKQEKSEKSNEKNAKVKKISDISLSKEAKIVYNYLDRVEFYVDDLAGLDLSDDDIISALTELEIGGVIKAAPGGKYTVL
ncbi:MAG: DNA-processing protein DprA [Clostridia bacterium]|nr:DNA-processing protein DprA [Clostridia bacterium]